MGENTHIQWTDHTFNPVRGCQKVSAGCEHCYAETLSKRNPGVLGIWGPLGTRVIASEEYWRKPVNWNKKARKAGIRRRVFCSSLADIFEDRPELIEPRTRLFDLIEQTPYLDWLLLTKRPENISAMLPQAWLAAPLPNVWLGVTAENQAMAERRLPILIETPARVRFVSAEPLLSALDLSPWLDRIGWVIVGGESGSGARLMRKEWAIDILDQCAAAGVPAFFKQKGAILARAMGCRDKQKGGDITEFPPEFQVRQWPRPAVSLDQL